MKPLNAFRLVLAAALLYLLPGALSAQVDTDALTDETQIMAEGDDRLGLVWWIPSEYWLALDKEDPSGGFDELAKMFEPYTVFMIVDGKIGTFGTVTYKDAAYIEENIYLLDRNGDRHRPLNDDEIDGDMKTILLMLKPMFANMFGEMGEHMDFYLFPGKNAAGQNLVQPKEVETFSVNLDGEKYEWNLPLGALLPPKYCPVDNKKMSGAWQYCPWHGNKLN